MSSAAGTSGSKLRAITGGQEGLGTGRSLHVFVVDDQRTNRRLVSKLASGLRSGVEVHEFEGPQDAVDAAATTTPDLVITDYRMPEMTGAELIRQLRQWHACDQTPMIVVTAYNEQSFRYDALRAGATDFLISPVDHEEFKARAGNLLTLRFQQRILQRRASMLKARLKNRSRLQREELRHSEDKSRLVMNTVPAMVSAFDRSGHCVYINNRQGVFLGVDPEMVTEQPMEAVFDADYAAKHRALNDLVVARNEPIEDIEETLVDAHGVEYFFLTTKAPLNDTADDVSSIVTVSVDISERKKLEERLWHEAHYDALTGLPNRKLLEQQLARWLGTDGNGSPGLAVFYLDLDGFKHINDAYGHGVGDEVLQATAERLSDWAVPCDMLARLGGDEFICVIRDAPETRQVDYLAQNLMDALDEPVKATGLTFQIRGSIGIALRAAATSAPASLLANANAALYRAKAKGRHCWAYYKPELTEQAQRRIQIEAALRHALESDPGQLALALQPVRDLTTSELVAYEALVRWQHPDEGFVPPNEFIPLAEATGLIRVLGAQMLEASGRWMMAHAEPDSRQQIAINISPAEIASSDFEERCRTILARTGLPAHRLELEITENGLMDQDRETLERLESLRRDGITIAIDDFGTGYSSLQYIKALPADRLKMDRAFIAGISRDPDNRAIVAATVAIADHFGLEVVGEGVEDPEDAATLKELGLDRVQGYLYGYPQIVGSFDDA